MLYSGRSIATLTFPVYTSLIQWGPFSSEILCLRIQNGLSLTASIRGYTILTLTVHVRGLVLNWR